VVQEVRVGAAQASNEVIFEGANGAFRRLATVNTWRHELEIDVLITKELFEGSAALIVKALELGAEASMNELKLDGLVCGEDGGTGLVGHGLSLGGVAVAVIQDEELGVSGAGREDEAACLVGEDLASRVSGHTCSIAEVGALTLEFRGREGIAGIGIGIGIGIGGGRVNREQQQLGGQFWGWVQVLEKLVEVAFDGSHRLRWMAAERGWGQAREFGDETFIEGSLQHQQ
jgi:hypothetical protein